MTGTTCKFYANLVGSQFETQEWSLETEDGKIIQLLEEERADPFRNTVLRAEAKGEVQEDNPQLIK